MQVGEEHLVLAGAEPWVLDGDRLLDAEHHVGGGPDVVRVVEDLRPGGDEVLVRNGRADAGLLLDEDRVAGGRELAHARRGDCHPVLVCLHFFGDTDDHLFDLTALVLTATA